MYMCTGTVVIPIYIICNLILSIFADLLLGGISWIFQHVQQVESQISWGPKAQGNYNIGRSYRDQPGLYKRHHHGPRTCDGNPEQP